ncbi:MAG: N-acetylmuramoyl-L-alanine amidase [Clostridiales bacterium]|nr:N-acetylmuramoyl-L-alanine amidase [Clostridiales bacterium]
MKKEGWKKILIGVLSAVVAVTSFGIWRHQRTVQAINIISVRLPGRQLILDAGHGGEDGGAVSVTGVPESGINLSIVLKMDQLLGFCGVEPVLLRDSDTSLHDAEADTLRKKKVSDLHNRVSVIEGTENALVVSIHQNTFSNPAYHGCQVFYRPGEESLTLAVLVQDTVRTALDPANKRTPTQISDSVYLMKHITCPAVLVECGFLSNAPEEAKLRSEGYQTQMALCVTSAVMRSGKINGGGENDPVL